MRSKICSATPLPPILKNKARLFLVYLGLVLAACTPPQAATLEATLTLIPATVTSTAVPPTITPTDADLPGPEDLITPSPPSSVSVPAIAQSLVQRALNDLAVRLEIDSDSIQLVRVEEAVWTSLDLGCGEVTRSPAGALEIRGYLIVLATAEQTYEYHSDDRASVRLCELEGEISGRVETLLVETDPIAAGLVALARRRLAADLEVELDEIRLEDITQFEWMDSSLGCIIPGQTYLPVRVEGYRIVLAAGDQRFIYHSDSEQIVLCAPENERLPGVTPTPDSP